MDGGQPVGVGGVASGDSTSKLLSVLSYLLVLPSLPWCLFPIVPLVMKRDAFSLYHAKQAVTLMIVSVVGVIVCIPLVVIFIGIPLLLAVVVMTIVLVVFGVVNVAHDRMQPLPIVGGWGERWWSGLQAAEGV